MSKTKDSKDKGVPQEEEKAWNAFISKPKTSVEAAGFAEWQTFIKLVEKQNVHRKNLATLDPQKRKIELTNHQPNIPVEISTIEITSLDRNERKVWQDKGGVEQFVDLHGLRKEDAFKRVYNTILTAYEGKTKVLKIITGKGKDQKDEFGELYISIKSLLPQWLAVPELKIKIRKVTPAIESDGGEGAFYVYLKKKK